MRKNKSISCYHILFINIMRIAINHTVIKNYNTVSTIESMYKGQMSRIESFSIDIMKISYAGKHFLLARNMAIISYLYKSIPYNYNCQFLLTDNVHYTYRTIK